MTEPRERASQRHLSGSLRVLGLRTPKEKPYRPLRKVSGQEPFRGHSSVGAVVCGNMVPSAMDRLVNRRIAPVWEIGEIPFHIGARKTSANPSLPAVLPFRVGVDLDLGMLVQMPDSEISSMLGRAYRLGSQIGTPLNETGLGRRSCDDVLRFIQDCTGTASLKGMKILEIGCGTGYLLKRLHELGADVLGFEPGLNSPVYAKQAGLRILRRPFAREAVDRKFDLILHYAVLEHAEDPLRFLNDQSDSLAPGGAILFSVPDCSPPIAHGDVSMFVHEHWSYFTEESLRRTASHIGMKVEACRAGDVSGAIYSAWSRGTSPQPEECRDVLTWAGEFKSRARNGLEAIRQYLKGKESLGIYCPARFLNYLQMLSPDRDGIRFFDDDPHLSGKYLPPFAISIEPRASLLEKPVRDLLIMSRTFGPALRDELAGRPELRDCRIVTVEDLL